MISPSSCPRLSLLCTDAKPIFLKHMSNQFISWLKTFHNFLPISIKKKKKPNLVAWPLKTFLGSFSFHSFLLCYLKLQFSKLPPDINPLLRKQTDPVPSALTWWVRISCRSQSMSFHQETFHPAGWITRLSRVITTWCHLYCSIYHARENRPATPFSPSPITN